MEQEIELNKFVLDFVTMDERIEGQTMESTTHEYLLMYLLHPYTHKNEERNCVIVKKLIKVKSEEYNAAICSDADQDDPTKIIFLDRPGNEFYRVQIS